MSVISADTRHNIEMKGLIIKLHERISALEVALAQSQALHSTQPHPLLSSTYLYSPRDRNRLAPIKDDAEKEKEKEKEMEDEEMPEGDHDDVVDSAFGTLTLGKGGQSRFVGSFAGSEYLRDTLGEGETGEGTATPPISAIGMPMSSIPLAIVGMKVRPGVDVEALRRELPDRDGEGASLVKNYWVNVNWM